MQGIAICDTLFVSVSLFWCPNQYFTHALKFDCMDEPTKLNGGIAICDT